MTARTWTVGTQLGITAGIAMALSLCLATPRAWASCTVDPECSANDEGTGCCDADCMWKPTNDTCRLETDSCHRGTCSAEHVCIASGQNTPNGTTCFPQPPYNVCSRGECHGGACTGIGSASSTEYGARCPDTDGNQCTDHCITDSNGVFLGCGTENIPNGATCYSSSGSSCQKGECSSGQCSNLSTVVTCSAPPDCKRRICDPVTLACDLVPDPSDTCDDNPNDCKDKYCTNTGACKSVNKDPYTACVPTASNDDGNPCTEEQCSASGSCVLHIPYANNSHPPGCDENVFGYCRLATCVDQSGVVTCQMLIDYTKNGTGCATDNNPCTKETCTDGTCYFSYCKTGEFCTVCSNIGACQGTTQSDCTCVFQ